MKLAACNCIFIEKNNTSEFVKQTRQRPNDWFLPKYWRADIRMNFKKQKITESESWKDIGAIYLQRLVNVLVLSFYK